MSNSLTIYDIPRDVLNIIKQMLSPVDYFRVLQVSWLFHDPNTEAQRKFEKIREIVVSRTHCGICGCPCSRCTKKPQKPMSAFLFFLRDMRPIMKRENPTLCFKELTRTIGDRWQRIPVEQTIFYENLAERYNREMSEY